MIKRGDVSGQFYLVSAIILIVIIISLVTISNYSKSEEYTNLKALKEEIQIEGSKVLDYGLVQNLNQADMNLLMQNFTKHYISAYSRDKNLYFIFGDSENISIKGYQNQPNEVSLDTTLVANSIGEISGSINPSLSIINLTIEENSYEFDLMYGENFYFIISKQTDRGNYVLTG